MKKYIVKFEYRTSWNTLNDIHDDSQWIVTDREIETLAEQWGRSVAELLEQIDIVEG